MDYHLAEIKRIEAQLKATGVFDIIRRLQIDEPRLAMIESLRTAIALQEKPFRDLARQFEEITRPASALALDLPAFRIPAATHEIAEKILRDFATRHAAMLSSLSLPPGWNRLDMSAISPASVGTRVRESTRMILRETGAPDAVAEDVDEAVELLEPSVSVVATRLANDEILVPPTSDTTMEETLLVAGAVGTAIVQEAHQRDVRMSRGILHTTVRVVHEGMVSGAFNLAAIAVCQALGLPPSLLFGTYAAFAIIEPLSKSLGDSPESEEPDEDS